MSVSVKSVGNSQTSTEKFLCTVDSSWRRSLCGTGQSTELKVQVRVECTATYQISVWPPTHSKAHDHHGRGCGYIWRAREVWEDQCETDVQTQQNCCTTKLSTSGCLHKTCERWEYLTWIVKGVSNAPFLTEELWIVNGVTCLCGDGRRLNFSRRLHTPEYMGNEIWTG